MQTDQLLCWSGMTDTEHSTTSNSNEEEEDPIYTCPPISPTRASYGYAEMAIHTVSID